MTTVENKYYIPTIEEFHVGFEYEYKYPDFPNIDSAWVKYETPEFNPEREDYCLSSDRKQFRVKYLDTEDIESLGFTKRGKTWAGYVDYLYTGLIDGKVPYYLDATIHIPLMDDMYKIILHRHVGEDINIDKQIKQGESELMFRGRLKNKSELKTIMKQVGIL